MEDGPSQFTPVEDPLSSIYHSQRIFDGDTFLASGREFGFLRVEADAT